MNPGIFGDPGLGRNIGLNPGENTNLTHGVYTFLTSGNWVCPDGVFTVWLTGIGGGGGSGGSNGSTGGSSPGGGSGYFGAKIPVAVVPGTVYPVAIGAGGLYGQGSPQTAGSSGGATSFGSLYSFAGGAGSPGQQSYLQLGGAGGVQGGSSAAPYGGNPNGQVDFNNGYNLAGAANSGAGGGGTLPSTLQNGNSGGSGKLMVEW